MNEPERFKKCVRWSCQTTSLSSSSSGLINLISSLTINMTRAEYLMKPYNLLQEIPPKNPISFHCQSFALSLSLSLSLSLCFPFVHVYFAAIMSSEQIWRNFATWAKFWMSLGSFKKLKLEFGIFKAYFGTLLYHCTIGQVPIGINGPILKNNRTIWSHWSWVFFLPVSFLTKMPTHYFFLFTLPFRLCL